MLNTFTIPKWHFAVPQLLRHVTIYYITTGPDVVEFKYHTSYLYLSGLQKVKKFAIGWAARRSLVKHSVVLYFRVIITHVCFILPTSGCTEHNGQ